MMELYFIRHGSTDLNEKKVLRGWLDPELSELGIKQSQLLADHLKDIEPTAIYTSDLNRSLACAELIAEAAGLPFENTKALRPINFGDLQGRPLDEISSDLDKIMDCWKFDPNINVPNGESFRTFQDRTYDFITDVIGEADTDDCIFFVTHLRVCLYATQLVINKFEKLKGDDLDKLNTFDIYAGNYVKAMQLENKGMFHICGINQLDQGEIENEQSEETSAVGT